jgi:hypothetical protein
MSFDSTRSSFGQCRRTNSTRRLAGCFMRCSACLGELRPLSSRRYIHASRRRWEQESPARAEFVRRFLRDKSLVLSSNFQKQRHSLESRLSNLSQELSKISGYQSIEGLKQQVEQHGMYFPARPSRAHSCRQRSSSQTLGKQPSRRKRPILWLFKPERHHR